MWHERLPVHDDHRRLVGCEPRPERVREVDNHPDRPAEVRELPQQADNHERHAFSRGGDPREQRGGGVDEPRERMTDDPVRWVLVQDGKGDLGASDAEDVGLGGGEEDGKL